MIIDPSKSSTEKYILENEYVFSLPVDVIYGKKISFKPRSLRQIIFLKFLNFKNGLSIFFKEIIRYRVFLKKIKNLKGVCVNDKAIVIGNGPSQGYLSLDLLEALKENGTKIFVVNFWNQNKILSRVIPDYLVISDPDTLNMEVENTITKTKNESLLKYIEDNKEIKIFCPVRRYKELSEKLGAERLIGFIDSDLRFWTDNISPLWPRGYVGTTLYKALALAQWLGFKQIYLIGMDNTYPRNIYCDQNNKIYNYEVHAGTGDYLADISSLNECVGDRLFGLSFLYYDAKLLKKNVINMDPYSLTDAFDKIKINSNDILTDIKKYILDNNS